MALSEALKNILMQQAAAGGARPMPDGMAGGMPMARRGGQAVGGNPAAARGKAARGAKAAKGGKGRPAPKGKQAAKKPAPSRGGKGPVKKKAAR